MKPDMSREAIGGRLGLMGELWELAMALSNSKIIRPATSPDEISELVEEFCSAANSKADFATPASKDHRLHAQMSSSYRKLNSFGKVGRGALANLLTNESIYVRTWVATALLADGHPDARRVLEEIAREAGQKGFDARTVLAEFDAGRLRTPFPEN